jgi:hypothetical protein
MNIRMKPFHPTAARVIVIGLALAFAAAFSKAADETPAAMSASELAGRLSALRQDGSSYVRARMEIKGAAKQTLQIQIKERRTRGATEIVYQVLWPKERKGESVLLRKAGSRPATGAHFTPPSTTRPIDAGQINEPLLGSSLSYEDVVENFFAWDQQSIVGSEDVNGVSCQILESKPGKGERSSYARVRTWADPKRLVPHRIEKYSASGQLVRRIDTTRVVVDDRRRPIPANLTVRDPREDSITDIDGSRIKHGVAFADREFTPEGIGELTTSVSAAE